MGTDEVLDTNLLIDGEKGTSTILNAVEYPKALEEGNRFLLPRKKDYVLAVEIATALLQKGKPLPAMDIIIAAICLNRRVALRTKDTHFKFIQDLYPGFELRLDG